MIALLGKKLGMTQVFTDQATLIAVTIMQFSKNYVLSAKKQINNKYTIRLASNPVTSKHLTKAQQGEYTAAGIPLQRDIVEVCDFDISCSVGDSFTVSLFKETGYIDVIGWSKGRGYQGVVRRYGFGGGRASHGSKFHREVGSTGMAAYPAKTLKNTKMAGRMGVTRVAVQNLSLVKVDEENNTIVVRGAIPGAVGQKIIIRSAIKKFWGENSGN